MDRVEGSTSQLGRARALRIGTLLLALGVAAPGWSADIPGDANCDGGLDASDVGEVIAVVFGATTDCVNIDPDGNGRVNAADLIAIEQFVAAGLGTPTPTPTTEPTPTPTVGGATFADVQTMIFDAPGAGRCTSLVGCHAGAFPQGGLSLVAGVSYDQLVTTGPGGSIVGRQPVNFAARSMGLLRVDPGNPDNSYLFIKVAGPLTPALGTRMPQGAAALTAAQIQLLRDWITAGALP